MLELLPYGPDVIHLPMTTTEPAQPLQTGNQLCILLEAMRSRRFRA